MENFQVRGQKRPADDNLESAQRLSKRLNALSLEYDPKVPIVVKPPTPERRKRSNAFSDSMNLDDFRDRVYIHNLDEEIEEIESEDEKLIFLPDIEKRLTKIPASVLVGHNPPPPNTEVVLYSVPESLSVSPEQDLVHKVIAETRARARKKLQDPQSVDREHNTILARGSTQIAHPHDSSGQDLDMDYNDAMDLG